VHITALYIYPVKACRAIACDEATLGPLGLDGDRRFAFIAADGVALTQRDQPLLAAVVPGVNTDVLRLNLGGLAELDVPLASFTEHAVVDVWGNRIPGRAARELESVNDYLGQRARLVMLERSAERSFADSRPVLVATSGALSRLGLPQVGMERFRPNVVVEGDGEWRELRSADCVLEFSKPCGRCEVTTIDQASGARRGPEPLRTLTERFGGEFGRYYRVVRAGRLRRGERLTAS
jgi:uncharacterized protein YcbX